jgi:FtsP/CotA-like multicopper oxidase with cupredoxin domain
MRRFLVAVFAVGFWACQPAAPTLPQEQLPNQEQVPVEEPLTPVWGSSALPDENPDPNIVEVTLVAKQAKVEYAPGRELDMYTYNGKVPGPLIQAKPKQRLIVHFKNELPESTTIHWHGLRIPDTMDGSPLIQNPVQPGASFDYDFVVPESGSFWYHPHVRANEQIEKGLYGPLVVHGENDPKYDLERYLMLDDILLDKGAMPPFLDNGAMEELMHGRWGNVLLVNGRSNGNNLTQSVTRGTVERWRLVNTSNARTYELNIKNASFRIIGTDGGYLRSPFTTNRLLLPVGQRYDVEVSYDTLGSVELTSIETFFDQNNNPVDKTTTLWTVLVDDTNGKAPPAFDVPQGSWVSRTPTRNETIALTAIQGGEHGIEWQINGKSHYHEPLFTFTEGEVVKFTIKNGLGPEHPFHLHGQFFEILKSPLPNHEGLKDVVLIPGFSGFDAQSPAIEIVAYMDNPGRWMAHCHILEHAELGMMAEILVLPKDGSSTETHSH